MWRNDFGILTQEDMQLYQVIHYVHVYNEKCVWWNINENKCKISYLHISEVGILD